MNEQSPVYIRHRGRVTGPFSRDQLSQMITRGQVSRLHQISTDGSSWQSLDAFQAPPPSRMKRAPSTREQTASVDDPSTQHARKASDAPAETPEAQTAQAEPAQSTASEPAAEAEPEPEQHWFYSVDRRQVGPVPESLLKQMVRDRQLNNDTLVWREGMVDWAPLPHSELAAPAGASSASDGAATANPLARAAGSATAATSATVIGVVVGALVLLCLNIPIVGETETDWWWDLPSTGFRLSVTLMILAAVALCIVAPLVSGLPRAIVATSIATAGVLSLFLTIMSTEQQQFTWMLPPLFLTAMAAGTSALARLRMSSSAFLRGRAAGAIVGGIMTGLAAIMLIVTGIYLMRQINSDVDMLASVSTALLITMGGYLAMIAAGICALSGLAGSASRSLAEAQCVLACAGPLMLALAGVILFGAGMNAFASFGMPAGEALPTYQAAQIYLLGTRIMLILLAPFVLLESGLYELLRSVEPAHQRGAANGASSA